MKFLRKFTLTALLLALTCRILAFSLHPLEKGLFLAQKGAQISQAADSGPMGSDAGILDFRINKTHHRYSGKHALKHYVALSPSTLPPLCFITVQIQSHRCSSLIDLDTASRPPNA